VWAQVSLWTVAENLALTAFNLLTIQPIADCCGDGDVPWT